MAGASTIEWTDATWNPVGGCSIASPGCQPCYAMQLAGTRLKNHPLYKGTTSMESGRPVFNGVLTVLPDNHPAWTFPVRWRGAKEPVMGPGQPSLIFAGDMSDATHEGRAAWQFRRMLAVAALSPHIVQFLTKRPDVMHREIEAILGSTAAPRGVRCPPWSALLNQVEHIWADDPSYLKSVRPVLERALSGKGPLADGALPNVWLGFSAERQKEFDERWPHMKKLAELGFTIFLSYEPAMGPLVLPDDFLALGSRAQVIAGGVSGRYARKPPQPDWFRSVRDQCASAGVAFFFKQWGAFLHEDQQDAEGRACHAAWTGGGGDGMAGYHQWDDGTASLRIGKKAAGALLDGRAHREFPQVTALEAT